MFLHTLKCKFFYENLLFKEGKHQSPLFYFVKIENYGSDCYAFWQYSGINIEASILIVKFITIPLRVIMPMNLV